MSLKKILLVAVTSLVVYGGLALPCQAQSSFRRHRPLRWLGQGFSDGYHSHNPGHDTSYYNPYTAHNSTLVSRSPEYQALLAQQAHQQPAQRFFSGVPFSVYAAPGQFDSGMQVMGQQVQGTFAPSVGVGVLEIDPDDDLDNSFKRSNDDDNDFREDNDFQAEDDDFDEDMMDDDMMDDDTMDDDTMDDDMMDKDTMDDDMMDDDMMDDDMMDDDMMDKDTMDKDTMEKAKAHGAGGSHTKEMDTSGLTNLDDSLSFDFE